MELTDDELLLKLRDYEDTFVERKSSGDSRDWLKTCVAFANSAATGYPAIMFVGVRNDGTVEDAVNLDSLQKTLSKKLSDAFPAIQYVTKILKDNGRQFLAVVVPGSGNKPHFAGPSYVRVGSESRLASEQQFTELIASRTSKAGEILKWRNRPVTVHRLNVNYVMHAVGRIGSTVEMFVHDCNAFYVTLSQGEARTSFPLPIVDLSFDNEKNRLALEIRPA
jgi:predicted HTH transcriptional regulator